MATRRMRIKATINVPRGGVKTEPVEQPKTEVALAVSDVVAPGPREDIPKSPVPARACTPPIAIPSSPQSPLPVTWQGLERPSPSKSPAALPPSGTILRRSPSPALSRLCNSPGPPAHYPPSPTKSPVPSYTSPHSPVKFLSRTPVVVIPTSTVSLSGGLFRTSNETVYPTSSSPSLENVKSPVNNLFRPPPSPSAIYQDFHSIKSPPGVTRPSPAQSPVFPTSRPPSNSSASFLSHHLNSNSNSADSHEVATFMSANAPKSVTRDTVSSRGSHGSGQGAFSSVSSNVNPSPSFAKSVFENPESLKKRSDEIRKKDQTNPSKFATARKEFFDKLQSGQTPERSKLTMLHFTFYNPPNPDGSTKITLGKKRSRSRASSVCSDVSSISNVKLENDGKNDENAAAKANSAPSSIAGSRRTTASSVISTGSCVGSEGGHSEAGSVASNASSGSMPGPRVKVGPDGQLIIDEKSLVVETSESQRARQQIEDMEVVSGADYAVGSSGFYRYKKNYRRGSDWTERETIRFYRALNQCGTDFSMMCALFPNRSRQELKSKFKREDRKNPDMISKALASCIFDPDEGISSEEETEKQKLLNEEKEVEEVICMSEDGKKKKSRKKKEITFSKAQTQEMEDTKVFIKGKGTGNGKAWNTPVKGLQKLKLNTVAGSAGIVADINIKKEKEDKPKRKYVRKKKPPVETQDDGASITTPAPTASIIISTGTVSNASVGLAEVKLEEDINQAEAVKGVNEVGSVEGGNKRRNRITKSKPNFSAPTAATASIIISTGPVSTASVGLAEVKLEKDTNQADAAKGTNEVGSVVEASNKRRNRITKSKPNFKKPGSANKAKSLATNEVKENSSQSTDKPISSEDLFSYDINEGLGPKVATPVVPVAQETELVGNEEGTDMLVIVDLDELKTIEKEDKAVSSVKITPPPKKRKLADDSGSATKVIAPVGAADPYGVAAMAAPVNIYDTEMSEPMDTNLATTSKVRGLQYRVPGPGGTSSAPRPAPVSGELEIEIEIGCDATES